jgi:tRNA A-37 threonylcarbamoyl transferase component Bud32
VVSSDTEAPELAATRIARKWATSDVVREVRGGQAVYAKTYHRGAVPGATAEAIRARTARESELLDRMTTSGLFGPCLGTVGLVGADPAAGRIVTAEVPGTDLSKVIWAPYRARTALSCLRPLYLAGKWLAHFQMLPVQPGDELQIGESDPLSMPDYCDVRLARMREMGYGWPSDGFRERMKAYVAELVQHASTEDRQVVWCHGDYCTQNILWDGTNLTPLDFAMAHLDYPLTDVTYLIHRLEMLRVYFPWRRWPLGAWRRMILRGFGRPEADRSPMYQALMIRHLHCRLLTYVRRKPLSVKERLHNAWVRRWLRSELERRVFAASS